jgi:hypothetical protein
VYAPRESRVSMNLNIFLTHILPCILPCILLTQMRSSFSFVVSTSQIIDHRSLPFSTSLFRHLGFHDLGFLGVYSLRCMVSLVPISSHFCFLPSLFGHLGFHALGFPHLHSIVRSFKLTVLLRIVCLASMSSGSACSETCLLFFRGVVRARSCASSEREVTIPSVVSTRLQYCITFFCSFRSRAALISPL